MTTITATPSDTLTPHPLPAARRWSGAVAFEATKLTSVRSTWLGLATGLVVEVGVSRIIQYAVFPS